MRELAYIQKITALKPIPGADKIECAEILGWEVVVKRGDFQVGDLVVYCEIDSILPELPPFEFLRPRKFRIRTIKLKQQVSQGIAFPLSVLTEVDPSINLSKVKVGQDMTEVLKITKYDPEALLDVEPTVKKSWLANKWSFLKWKLFGIKPIKKGSFPSDVPKTDEERVQKMGGKLEKRAGDLVYISEKLEGTSATFIYRRGGGNWLSKLLGQNHIFQVCSRNRIIYNSRSGGTSNHHLVQVAEKKNILTAMKSVGRNLAIQGEVVGPKIQANIYKIPELDFRVFLVFDLDTQKYLDFREAFDLVAKMGLQFVPIIQTDVPLVNDVKHYVELSKGYSQINPQVLREGVVVRVMSGDFSFKSINPDYLLKQE